MSQTVKPTDNEVWNRKDLLDLSEPIPIGKDTNVSAHDADFVRDCRSLTRRSLSSINFLPWLAVAFVSVLLWWASRAEIDEVTRGVGKVIPSKSLQKVQSLEGGLIESILVTEGQLVEAGQELIHISDAIFASNYEENIAKRDVLAARLVRLRAEATGSDKLDFPENTRPDLSLSEIDLFEKRRTDYVATEEGLQSRLKLAKNEEGLLLDAKESGAVSPIELLRIQKEVAELESQLRMHATNAQRLAMEQYDQHKAELEALTEAIKRDKDRLDRTVLRSPVRGTINKIYLNTEGRVIGSGEDIMDIVPSDDTLLVEANVRPSDIAFIHPNQDAMVKFTAYDFTTYGGLEGQVEHISADTITDEQGESFYQIKVRTTDNTLGKDSKGQELPIIPGMVTEIDILTGEKTVLTYLLKPITRARERAFRER